MPNDTARQVAIEAKHLRPRLDHVSLRPGAAEVFGSAFARRLTVVCAPAGYGKTTTTAAALDHCGRASSWYKLDVLDNDPLAFLAAMTRAVQRVYPDFGAALLRELESGPVSDLPAEVLAARFCSECDRLVEADLHLVLDDYHEAMDSAALNAVLGYLLENCATTVHFVVLTRYEPAFRLEKLHLGGEVARMPRDLFLFDEGQVADVLAQRSGRRHDPQHVQRLHQLTEGWPASVVLAGMTLTWLDVASLEEALADPRLRSDVFSYLAEQVFQRQSEEVRHFLLSTCCLEHVTAELAEALTGSPGASRHLHFLARNHIFTFDTERAGAYRYHNLLRDFLRQRFVHDEGEGAFRSLQRRTAVALEDCGERPGAIELLLGANELDLALGVIARGGEAELERRPSEQLRIWVARLTPAIQADEPWALVVSGVLAARESKFSIALQHLRKAVFAFEVAGDTDATYQALSILEWAEFWSGDSATSMATSSKALDYAKSDGQRLHSLLSLLSAALDMRRWEEVDRASQRADELLPGASEAEAARAQALRAHAAYYRGDMRAAQNLIQRGRHSRQTGAQLAASLNTHGMIHMALGQFESAARDLELATEVAEDFGQVLTSYMIEDNVALLEASIGAFENAEHRLRRLLTRSHELDPTILCFVMTHLGTVLRRKNELEASIEPSGLATEAVSSDRDPYLALNSRANLALSEGLLGRDRIGQLKELSSAAATSGVRFVELKALLYAAILEFAAGSKQAALELLESCVSEQLALGHINLLAQELCPRPEIVMLVLRKDRDDALGLPLLSALGLHWDFVETVRVLQQLGTHHMGMLLNRILEARAVPADSAGVRRSSSIKPMFPSSPLADLTPKELSVLQLMAENQTNAEIAAELFIALSTVKTHVNHILRKLDQKTRIGAILEYQRISQSSPPTLRAEINPRFDSSRNPRN